MTLYANCTGTDTVRYAFSKLSNGVGEIYLVSPFFTYDSLITELLEKDILVRIIVRLGPRTSPDALKNLLSNDGIQIRYFTSPEFHSKLYVFGDKFALIGSANLTEAGLQRNREICVEINSEDERFDRLVSLFISYWNQADVLTPERLKKYTRIYEKRNVDIENSKLEKRIIEEFGNLSPMEGIEVGRKQPPKEKVFLESYRRTYQEFLSAFRVLEALYKEDGRRQQPEDIVPLRIEIDSFFSFIREKFAIGDSYQTAPLRHGDSLDIYIKEMLEQWFSQRWDYLDEVIPGNISRIFNRLSTKSSIENASIDEIYDALLVCHSFYDRFRFYLGGHETMKVEFIRDNDLNQIKKVLIYLFHGKDDFIDRMGTCIFNEEYKIYHVGRSVIQELLGWVNKENIPICNGRTVKALRYLGFNVVVFN